MKKFYPAFLMVVAGVAGVFADAGASTRPAMVGSGGNSFAAHLHYPPTARAQRKQAAVTFYCEIGTDGRPRQTDLSGKAAPEFNQMVNQALRQSRFEPAMVDGKAVPVIVGGTVLFLFHRNQPHLIVSLSTAEPEKIARMSNYIQPQLLASSAELRRIIDRKRSSAGTNTAASPMEPSLISYRTFDIDYMPAGMARAEVLAHVDVNGNVGATRLLAETPPNGGLGVALAKALQNARFIPALNNGRPAAGDFNLPIQRAPL
jgi:TonB-like protein